MSFDIKDDTVRRATIERAGAWYARNRAAGLTPEEKTAFLAWLRESQLNMHEYLAVSGMGRGLRGALARLDPDKDALIEQARADLREGTSSSSVLIAASRGKGDVPKPRRLNLWASAALVLLALSGLWLTIATIQRDRIVVPRGEQRTVRLEDGSVVHVNAASELSLRFSSKERRIDLSSGQALFDVARDKARPFRVRAGDTEVVAIGTRFDVNRETDRQVTVTVLDGKVEVLRRSGGSSPVPLGAGQQIHIGMARTSPQVQSVDAGTATAWVRGQAIFQGESLAEVVKELNRYSTVPVRIEDPQLLKMRINGVFNAYDVESFLGFLNQFDVEVESDSHAIYIRRRSTPAQQ